MRIEKETRDGDTNFHVCTSLKKKERLTFGFGAGFSRSRVSEANCLNQLLGLLCIDSTYLFIKLFTLDEYVGSKGVKVSFFEGSVSVPCHSSKFFDVLAVIT